MYIHIVYNASVHNSGLGGVMWLCVCVCQDEKRMERMKRRLDELELVQNNVRLMNELLSHFRPESGEDERLLLKVCEERERKRDILLAMILHLYLDQPCLILH